jgi:hypothetical protein
MRTRVLALLSALALLACTPESAAAQQQTASAVSPALERFEIELTKAGSYAESLSVVRRMQRHRDSLGARERQVIKTMDSLGIEWRHLPPEVESQRLTDGIPRRLVVDYFVVPGIALMSAYAAGRADHDPGGYVDTMHFTTDKQLHYAAGFGIGSVMTRLLDPVWGTIVCASASGIFELGQRHGGGRSSGPDFIYAASGCVSNALVNRFLRS